SLGGAVPDEVHLVEVAHGQRVQPLNCALNLGGPQDLSCPQGPCPVGPQFLKFDVSDQTGVPDGGECKGRHKSLVFEGVATGRKQRGIPPAATLFAVLKPSLLLDHAEVCENADNKTEI